MFRKTYAIFIIMMLVCSGVGAQQGLSNSIAVNRVVSPIAKFNYREDDSVDFIIQIRNIGPNEIVAADQFHISYSISNNDTSIAADTNINVGMRMFVNDVQKYVIKRNITFNSAKNFAACADLSRGTDVFPDNLEKFSGECNTFIVGIKKNPLPLASVFYSNRQLNFRLRQALAIQAAVYDVSARLILTKTILPKQEQSINFSAPSKGIYFLVVTDIKGNKASAKFIVN